MGDLYHGRTGLWNNDSQSLGGDACRELDVLQTSPRRQIPQGGDEPLLRSDGLPHAGVLLRNIRGQQSQQTVKNGVCHPEIIPEIISIILLDLPQQRHVRELVMLEQPYLRPKTSSSPCSWTGLG
ncbi:hypothetical protein AB205_0096510 [Aquarana catesbeiana]|uniref:Uncharacterized protein n=1 Tax=Aquarana catesbeiana TaxID=8400 RepID=A0A2G9SLD7_AQUCT|nr:hypothetical protein AB205_0096510 [Aquarana catesbeiana]